MNTLSLVLKNRKLVLGRNERQLVYIRKSNLKPAKRIADNKVLTKQVLKKAGVPVPEKIKVIKNRDELEAFDFSTLPKSFVVKPVRGSRGGGIEIFYNQDKNGNFLRADKTRMSPKDLESHCIDILDGKYSLFNEPDIILIEERVQNHKNFKNYAYKGTPDIRIIVYNKIPIISYIRIPTRESNGKANLDLGAIGVGIDIAVGKTTTAIIGKATPIESLPDSNLSLSGIKIPYWDKILKYAIEASVATKLGFAAVDFLIDKEKGPLVVELNARPGLSIQIANQDGLRWRLKKAKGLKVKNTEHGIRLGKNLFGGEIEEEVEEITGKQVIGLVEKVKLIGKNGAEIEIEAKIDTGAGLTSIDEKLAIELGFKEAIEYSKEILKVLPNFKTVEEAKDYSVNNDFKARLERHDDITSTAIIKASNGIQYRIIVNTKFILSNIEIESKTSITSRENLEFQMIIGSKDLNKFLIDTTKTK